MPGSGIKRKQLRQLSLTCSFKKATREGDINLVKLPSTVSDVNNTDQQRINSTRSQSPAPMDSSSQPKDEEALGATCTDHVEGAEAMPYHSLSPTQPLADSPMTEDDERLEDDGGISDSPPKSSGSAQGKSWKGTAIEDLRSVYTLPRTIAPSSDHTVLFHPHIEPGRPPKPFPDSYRDIVDDYHIMMPCSPRSKISDAGSQHGPHTDTQRRRWDVIEEALRQKMTTAGDLREAILSYNSRMANSWKFETLEAFLHEELSAQEAKSFFSDLLPQIVKAALNLPNFVTTSIPLLLSNRSHSVSFTQLQLVSLLANAFFCTFVYRSGKHGGPDIPGVNFFRLYCAPVSQRKFEKLRCILHYFRRVFDAIPSGTVTFTRRCIDNGDLPNWSRLDIQLPEKLHVNSDGTIEDEGQDMLQVDFANKRIGGGVLGNGSVQEEIRFVLCPELIISRLFTETMDKNEAVVIVGAERFSDYSGYANSFKWNGNHNDQTKRDAWGRRMTCLVAIDATRFNRFQEQFPPPALKRELDKAFVGFEWDMLPRTVATGNWGCGAFRGNHELKALLQMMACAAARCNLCYFTFGDAELRDGIAEIHHLLTENRIAVKEIWRLICCYWKECVNQRRSASETLYTYLRKKMEEIDTE